MLLKQAADKEHFSQFITDEIFEQYLDRKRSDGVHGNNPEIQAVSELFNRPVEVFVTENGGESTIPVQLILWTCLFSTLTF